MEFRASQTVDGFLDGAIYIGFLIDCNDYVIYGIADLVALFAEQVFISFLCNIHNVPPVLLFAPS